MFWILVLGAARRLKVDRGERLQNGIGEVVGGIGRHALGREVGALFTQR